MIVEYLSTRYRYFDSVETERRDGVDGIQIRARHGNFIYTNIMPGNLRDARAVEGWLDHFIQDFDKRYRDHRFGENNKEWTKVNPYLNFNRNTTIKKVVFNNPATIVLWTDGTKTVVKCQNDEVFDPEKGLAMAIAKKAFGNKGNYCNEIKKWTEQYETNETESIEIKFDGKTIIREAIDKVQEHFDRTFTPGAPKEV
jgi:hypothetical protein